MKYNEQQVLLFSLLGVVDVKLRNGTRERTQIFTFERIGKNKNLELRNPPDEAENIKINSCNIIRLKVIWHLLTSWIDDG